MNNSYAARAQLTVGGSNRMSMGLADHRPCFIHHADSTVRHVGLWPRIRVAKAQLRERFGLSEHTNSSIHEVQAGAMGSVDAEQRALRL